MKRMKRMPVFLEGAFRQLFEHLNEIRIDQTVLRTAVFLNFAFGVGLGQCGGQRANQRASSTEDNEANEA